jgi:phenylacetate-CoA ligase
MSVISSLRKQIYKSALKFNRPATQELAFMRENQWLPSQHVKAIQQQRLEQLLNYAYEHVPYYKKLFDEIGLVHSGQIHLERFKELPILDKPTIRANFQALTSDEIGSLKVFKNRTGGSTGEPLVVLQDRDGVRMTGGAVLRLFYEWHGVEPGDKEIKLWGSERDLFYQSQINLSSVRQWMSGAKVLNAFLMTSERMRQYIATINDYKPKLLRGYSNNLYELAQFAEQNGLTIHPPNLVISSAGTLYPLFRQKMEDIYGCSAFNHYGTREMHNMAMECPEGKNLHISAFTHIIEVINENSQPCPPGVEGDLVITSLVEYAMPLIRYRIGDRGTLSQNNCSCGRGLPVLAELSGRKVNSFRTSDGRIVPGEYFIHLLGVYFHDHPIGKFQVIQEDYEVIYFKLIMRSGGYLASNIQQAIEEKTRLVMGQGCHIKFEYVDDIPPTSSGKYFYTICNIPDLPQPELAE